jgi:hypothetical protein
VAEGKIPVIAALVSLIRSLSTACDIEDEVFFWGKPEKGGGKNPWNRSVHGLY